MHLCGCGCGCVCVCACSILPQVRLETLTNSKAKRNYRQWSTISFRLWIKQSPRTVEDFPQWLFNKKVNSRSGIQNWDISLEKKMEAEFRNYEVNNLLSSLSGNRDLRTYSNSSEFTLCANLSEIYICGEHLTPIPQIDLTQIHYE